MLKEKINQDLNRAIKEKKEIETSVLRMLKAAIFNKEKEKRYKLSREKPELSGEELEKESQLKEEEIIEVLKSEIKKRKEGILMFEKGKREDLVKKEKMEIEILEKYLPEQLSREEIEKIAKETIREIGAKDQKEVGKVMKELIPKLKGRAEGGEVLKIVKELLNQ
jgi:uncharacterized protein YqeY